MTLTSRFLGSLAKLPSATSAAVTVERDLPAKMADGAVLLADRWYPAGAGTQYPPVVLLRTPYGRRQAGMVGRLFGERGYQVVIQSCRGTFGSGGDWVPFRNEHSDGRATLDWIAAQPWFNGDLFTFGPSYLGLAQWALAEGAPTYLRAMALDVTASNFRDALVYPSGSFALETSLTWLLQLENQERGWRGALGALLSTRRALQAGYWALPVAHADMATVGRRVLFFQDWILHEGSGDSWWDPVDFGQQLEDMPPAALSEVGTTSSCLLSSTTIAPCALPAGVHGSRSGRGLMSAPGSSGPACATDSSGSTLTARDSPARCHQAGCHTQGGASAGRHTQRGESL